MDKKPILCVDFDGVLHSYQSGWQGAAIAPDPPTPGAAKFLHDARKIFDVQIYSSRSKTSGGLVCMRGFINDMLLREYDYDVAEHVRQSLQYPRQKPPAFLTLDDRAICFDGTFPDPSDLIKFKPWNKR